ncbi:Gmad2 immunoglobulin-like domain-containing protein [Alkaliphilus serpentinus]|uniref:Bacterial spore germination immunoglobulin-like domain-containing protein n=1 Tax=Alkaliphilus serpentinus TaxID=1482731 RepID=A0A833M9S4_9FIRM|nr:Gmad2 immunoglobulin-like domain-containing protein [Alkaliphilus serpentinus]KAB3530685.1 hypothetical protein F8153_06135 [Alkaliphilus serpentinus]
MKKTIFLIAMIISISVYTACTQDVTVPDENNEPNTGEINNESHNNQQSSEYTNINPKDDSENNVKDAPSDGKVDLRKVVIKNDVFRIYQPAPGAEVKEKIVVKGLARIFEGTVLYEFEDGHNILDKGFTTATEGAPGWGEFEIVIQLDKDVANDSGSVILYEESAKDGSRRNELIIPVKIIQ